VLFSNYLFCGFWLGVRVVGCLSVCYVVLGVGYLLECGACDVSVR